jgi:hypothetical protein
MPFTQIPLLMSYITICHNYDANIRTFFETVWHYVAQAGLELMILLPQLLELQMCTTIPS